MKKYKSYGDYLEQTVSMDANPSGKPVQVQIRQGKSKILINRSEMGSLITALIAVGDYRGY